MNLIINGYAISIATEKISDDVTRVFHGPTSLPSCGYRPLGDKEEPPIEVAAYSLRLLDEKKPCGIFDVKGVKYLLYHVVWN